MALNLLFANGLGRLAKKYGPEVIERMKGQGGAIGKIGDALGAISTPVNGAIDAATNIASGNYAGAIDNAVDTGQWFMGRKKKNPMMAGVETTNRSII
jgi:hypothetical protein